MSYATAWIRDHEMGRGFYADIEKMTDSVVVADIYQTFSETEDGEPIYEDGITDAVKAIPCMEAHVEFGMLHISTSTDCTVLIFDKPGQPRLLSDILQAIVLRSKNLLSKP